jgi:REP element-mobilizing transposase RayT
MSIKDRNEAALRSAGWHSRGYLPHFDGRAQPQFITLHLADSIPRAVIERWQRELRSENSLSERVFLQNRIEKYLDQGYGECVFKDKRVANMAQESLLRFDGSRYKLHSWVVMPNHLHFLITRAEELELCDILQTFKSYIAHETNKLLSRKGQLWMPEYYDRYIRNADHFRKTVRYIEMNPVKARLCKKPEDWPFSSASFRVHLNDDFE